MNKVKKAIKYADVVSGIWVTRTELFKQVRAYPVFTRPDEVAVVDSEGTEYTGRELCRMAGVKMKTIED